MDKCVWREGMCVCFVLYVVASACGGFKALLWALMWLEELSASWVKENLWPYEHGWLRAQPCCTYTHARTHTQWNEWDFTFSVLNCLDGFYGLNGSWRMVRERRRRRGRQEEREREKTTESERERETMKYKDRRRRRRRKEWRLKHASVQMRVNVLKQGRPSDKGLKKLVLVLD